MLSYRKEVTKSQHQDLIHNQSSFEIQRFIFIIKIGSSEHFTHQARDATTLNSIWGQTNMQHYSLFHGLILQFSSSYRFHLIIQTLVSNFNTNIYAKCEDKISERNCNVKIVRPSTLLSGIILLYIGLCIWICLFEEQASFRVEQVILNYGILLQHVAEKYSPSYGTPFFFNICRF